MVDAVEGKTQLISVVLSFRNEHGVIPELIRRLVAVLSALPMEYELIFVDDDSTDQSLDLLREHVRENYRIKVITMSRRFGVAECVLAGMKCASGDAVVYMDADLQDPPEVIPRLVEEWRGGADVVYTVRTQRHGENPLKVWVTRAAYKVIQAMSRLDLPIDAGDFRLVSRRVLKEFEQLTETDPYIRGLVRWVGFRQVPVYYERAPRAAGEAHFPVLRSWGPAKLFLTALTSFSEVPLYAMFVVGFIATMASVIGFVAVKVIALFDSSTSTWTDLVLFLLFLWGTLLAALGLVGIYVSRIFNDVRRRPRYIVKDTIGFDR